MNATTDIGHHAERIRCPDCGHEQDATVQHTAPWPTYLHDCEQCHYLIMESEWAPAAAPENG